MAQAVYAWRGTSFLVNGITNTCIQHCMKLFVAVSSMRAHGVLCFRPKKLRGGDVCSPTFRSSSHATFSVLGSAARSARRSRCGPPLLSTVHVTLTKPSEPSHVWPRSETFHPPSAPRLAEEPLPHPHLPRPLRPLAHPLYTLLWWFCPLAPPLAPALFWAPSCAAPRPIQRLVGSAASAARGGPWREFATRRTRPRR